MFRPALLFWLALVAATGARADAPIPVVATFSILGDLVKNVGGDRIALQTLVGSNGDTHAYSPKPTDAKKLAAARLIFINGLDFERWLDRLIDSSSSKARVVTVSQGVAVRPSSSAKDAPDPHAWQSVPNVTIYVGNIRDALIAEDPASQTIYSANADAYIAQLNQLDSDLRAGISKIPEPKRRAITAHPSLDYFGAAYGLKFSSPQHLNNEAEASAKNVAATVDQIRRDKVAATFAESAGDPRLMQQIAAETGIRLGGALYTDALTDSSGPAPSYIAMMRQNLRTIETALKD